MDNKPLLSIAIPTYNREICLKNLLNRIAPEAEKLAGLVEICISSNGSTDNTREVVLVFQKKYPSIIKYNENENDLGFDRNVLKVMEMSSGDYIWTFGDDDSITDGGLAEVVNFLKKVDKKSTGLIVARMDLYFIDKETKQKVFYGSFLDKGKPDVFNLDKNDIIGIPFSDPGSMSPLIFNSDFLKNIIRDESEMVEKAVGIVFMHAVLRSLMFLKYSHLSAIAINKPIIFMVVNPYKFFVEDKFVLNYQGQKKFNGMLLSYRHMNSNYVPLIIKNNNMLKWGFIMNIIVMRAFNNLNYFSYFGCLKLFFQQAKFMDALLFSFVFSILCLTPPIILVWLYKTLLMARHGKKWKERWFLTSNFNLIINQGTRRQPM